MGTVMRQTAEQEKITAKNPARDCIQSSKDSTNSAANSKEANGKQAWQGWCTPVLPGGRARSNGSSRSSLTMEQVRDQSGIQEAAFVCLLLFCVCGGE